MTTICLTEMSDRQLIATLAQVAASERRVIVELIALLGEVDARRLYLPEGCSSLFAYCTQVLGFSEHEAYLRIEAARAARRFPVILERLEEGELTLTTVATLRPHLTDEHVEALLSAASHKTKREVEHQVACLAPKPDAKTMIRRLPTAGSMPTRVRSEAAAPLLTAATGFAIDVPPAEPRPQSKPLSADRYLLRVTLSADAHAKLKRAQDLMRHRVSNGDPAAVVERALTLLVDHLERQKAAQTKRPRKQIADVVGPSSRYIPADVRRDVWVRDEGRCAFIGGQGRCTETAMLEFHHIEPFALGGPTTVGNISLRCRAHNQHES